MYAWWNNNHHHNYWRIYGGGISLRKWFGKASKVKPLQGHHLGINAQASDTVDRLVEMIPGAINKVSNFVSGFKGKTEDAAEVAETLSGDE